MSSFASHAKHHPGYAPSARTPGVMTVVGYLFVLLKVFWRILLVLAIGVPSLLFLIVAGALGPAIDGFAIVVVLALSGFAWAFLPLIHVGPKSGMAFGALWLASAAIHLLDSPESATGQVVVCWTMATLCLAILLKAQPPMYFPQSWRDAALDRDSRR